MDKQFIFLNMAVTCNVHLDLNFTVRIYDWFSRPTNQSVRGFQRLPELLAEQRK